MFSYLNEKALRKSLCPLVILLARGKIETVSHRVLKNRNNPQWPLPSPKFRRRRRRRRRTCLQLHRTPVPQASHRDHPVVGRDATIVTPIPRAPSPPVATQCPGHPAAVCPPRSFAALPVAWNRRSPVPRPCWPPLLWWHHWWWSSGCFPPQNRWCERLFRQSLRWFGRAASARARASRAHRSTSRFARTDRCLPRVPAGSIQR